MRTTRLLAFLFALLLILSICLALYWPGLSGPFLFDDFPNLAPIGRLGQIDDLDSVMAFLNTGFSGPTGRPVALLSFLIDSNTWPADPYSFKKTNILLHLATGLLLFWLIVLVFKTLRSASGPAVSVLIPVICFSWWMLHPLWVSTVLYVVQRMAILATFFSLLAIIFYLKARLLLYFKSERRPLQGYTLLMFAALSSCIAVLSKENAVILPMLMLILEIAFFACGRGGSAPIRTLVLLVFTVSTVLIVLYLLRAALVGWDLMDARRDFSVSDRFWTQGRVLWLYIADIVIPKLSTAGLFHSIEVSRGPLTPITSGLGWLAVIGVLWGTARCLRALPFTFLAIWLFFASHIIESTVISLELYFEHRSYLPGAFLSLILVDVFRCLAGRKRILYAVIALALCMNAVLLYARVQTWAEYPLMVQTWVKKAPESVRANLEVSRVMFDQGDVPSALHFLKRAETADPQSLQVGLWKLLVTCRINVEPASEQFERLQMLLSNGENSGTAVQYLGYIAEGAKGACEYLKFDHATALVEAYRSSPKVKGTRTEARLQLMLGMIHSRLGDGRDALENFEAGAKKLGDANSGMLGVSWLARESHYEEALQLLDVIAEGVQSGELSQHGADYAAEIWRIRRSVEDELAGKQG